MKSLTKSILSIIGVISAAVGFTLAATSCDDDDDDNKGESKVDCSKGDKCDLPECQNDLSCQATVYGPGPVNEVDCTKGDKCDLPECQNDPSCQTNVYGPAPVDEVDCTQPNACEKAECQDAPECQPSVYGPAYSEDMLKCCGDDITSEEFKACIDDYVKNGACDAKADEGMDVYGPAPAP